MTTQRERAERFQALHRRAGAFVIPNPWDAGSARILAALGFEALATTSAGFAFSIGRRDGAITRDDALAHARVIAAATDLPVSADLENCFGDDPKTVAETIRLSGQTGLVGGSVEDFSGDPKRPLYEFGHAVERVAAAAEAARALPFPFTLTARAENFLRGRTDIDDTIKRLQAFEKAGADVLYAPLLPITWSKFLLLKSRGRLPSGVSSAGAKNLEIPSCHWKSNDTLLPGKSFFTRYVPPCEMSRCSRVVR